MPRLSVPPPPMPQLAQGYPHVLDPARIEADLNSFYAAGRALGYDAPDATWETHSAEQGARWTEGRVWTPWGAVGVWAAFTSDEPAASTREATFFTVRGGRVYLDYFENPPWCKAWTAIRAALWLRNLDGDG